MPDHILFRLQAYPYQSHTKITEIFKSLMKNNILQLHNQSERTVEKIDCPFSMPMSRKERPPMTKPREKTREELQAEIEGGKEENPAV